MNCSSSGFCFRKRRGSANSVRSSSEGNPWGFLTFGGPIPNYQNSRLLVFEIANIPLCNKLLQEFPWRAWCYRLNPQGSYMSILLILRKRNKLLRSGEKAVSVVVGRSWPRKPLIMRESTGQRSNVQHLNYIIWARSYVDGLEARLHGGNRNNNPCKGFVGGHQSR
jgi:hypothetical protein